MRSTKNKLKNHQSLKALYKRYKQNKIADCDLINEIKKIENAVRRALKSNNVRLHHADPHWNG